MSWPAMGHRCGSEGPGCEELRPRRVPSSCPPCPPWPHIHTRCTDYGGCLRRSLLLRVRPNPSRSFCAILENRTVSSSSCCGRWPMLWPPPRRRWPTWFLRMPYGSSCRRPAWSRGPSASTYSVPLLRFHVRPRASNLALLLSRLS